MHENILLNWKFWLHFYYFLVYSWCLLHVIEVLTIGSLVVLVQSHAETLEKKIGIKNYDNLSLFLDGLSILFILIIFFGGVGTMLSKEGLEVFTVNHFVLFSFALLFTIGFYGFLLEKIKNYGSFGLQAIIPFIILFSYTLFYVFAFKFPGALLIYNYLGSLVYELFSIPLFPLIAILYSHAYGACLPSVLSIVLLPYSLLIFLRALLSPLTNWLTEYLNDPQLSQLIKDQSDVTPQDKNMARLFPNSLFAKGLVQNQNYEVTPEDIQVARNNPESEFTLGLADKFNLYRG